MEVLMLTYDLHTDYFAANSQTDWFVYWSVCGFMQIKKTTVIMLFPFCIVF